MEFPLNIVLCVRPGLNVTALRSLGYNGAPFFGTGLSMFNNTLLGWGGHDDKGKSLKSVKEVVNLVKPEWSKELPIRNMTNKLLSTNQLKLNTINWLDDCHTVNLTDVEYHTEEDFGQKDKKVYIVFNETMLKKIIGENNITFELKLQDKHLFAHRMIDEHRFFYNGPDMPLKNTFSMYMSRL